MAISALQAQEETVSRKVYEQISWERDIAVMLAQEDIDLTQLFESGRKKGKR